MPAFPFGHTAFPLPTSLTSTAAVGETAILLHPPLPLAGVPIGITNGCHQNDSLADGYRSWPPIRDTSCRCHPLTAVHCLRFGYSNGHSMFITACRSLPFHCLSLTSTDLSLPFTAFHCLSTAFP